MDTNPMKDCNDPKPGVNAPDPAHCHWCGRSLNIWTQPAYRDIPARHYCECMNEACIAYGATGAVTSYPDTAAQVVASRKAKRGTNKAAIDTIALGHFQIDADAPVSLLDIERARAAVGQLAK